MDYSELNFVETCTTTETPSSSVRSCYNSATAFNEFLLIFISFFIILFLITKIFSGNLIKKAS